MPLVTLTEITLRNLKPPDKGYIIYTDANLKGFGVRVTEAGHASYVLTYGRKRKRVTLGDVGIVKLAEARGKAKNLLSEYQLNGEKPKSVTWGNAKELYLTVHVEQNNKPSTQRETKRLLKRFDRLQDTRLSELQAGDVLSIVDKMLGTPSEANHHFVCAKAFLNWCVGRNYLAYNPLHGVKKPAKTSTRDRVLSDDELKAILASAPEAGTYGRIVLWCLYTLQRVGQITHLRTEYFDFNQQTIKWPAEAMKGNREHEVPYCRLHSNVPEAGFLFRNAKGHPWNAGGKPHKAFLEASGTAGWSLHDLRRTGATRLAELGTPPHVIERILAHASGTLTPLALIYNRATYLAEMREAMLAWDRHLSNSEE